MLDKSKLKIKTGGDFEPLPIDKYTAQITDINLVTQMNSFKGVEEDLLKFTFTILDDKQTEDGESTRGRLVWYRVTQSLGARAKLGKLAQAVYGRDLTKEEKESFDPEDMIGKQVDLLIDQNPDKNDSSIIYNNITSVSKNVKKLKSTDIQTSPTVVTKKTVAAVAPDAEEPEAFINNLEKENEKKREELSAGAESEEELAALEQEQRAAELAAKVSRARAEAAKKKAALQVKR